MTNQPPPVTKPPDEIFREIVLREIAKLENLTDAADLLMQELAAFLVANNPPRPPAGIPATITGGIANVRATPAPGGDMVRKLTTGTPVEIYGLPVTAGGFVWRALTPALDEWVISQRLKLEQENG